MSWEEEANQKVDLINFIASVLERYFISLVYTPTLS